MTFEEAVRYYMDHTTLREFAAQTFPELRAWLEQVERILASGEESGPSLTWLVSTTARFFNKDEYHTLRAAINQLVYDRGGFEP